MVKDYSGHGRKEFLKDCDEIKARLGRNQSHEKMDDSVADLGQLVDAARESEMENSHGQKEEIYLRAVETYQTAYGRVRSQLETFTQSNMNLRQEVTRLRKANQDLLDQAIGPKK